MHLKKNSWYYWLYTKTYGGNPPTNLCPFFWKLLFAIIAFPIMFSFFFVLEIGKSIFNLFIKEKEAKIDFQIEWKLVKQQYSLDKLKNWDTQKQNYSVKIYFNYAKNKTTAQFRKNFWWRIYSPGQFRRKYI